jgi:hypothetical protein
MDRIENQKKKKLRGTDRQPGTLCHKPKKLGVHRNRQQGDLISLISLRNYVEYTDRWTEKDTQAHRKQSDLISLNLFFQNKEIGQRKTCKPEII